MSSTTHKNNFDFIRLLAAITVWYSHCHNFYATSRYMFLSFFGGLAVTIFFIISGYFVTASYLHHGHLFPFLKNRVLRIYPAAIVVILLSVFVMGPLASVLEPEEYFSNPMTWRYLRLLLLFPMQTSLPGVFMEFPDINTTVNGSLWTLEYELICYGAIAFLGVMKWLRPRIMFGIFIALWIVGFYYKLAQLDQVPTMGIFNGKTLGSVCNLGTLFAGGSCMYLARAKIPLAIPYFAAACVVLVTSMCVCDHYLWGSCLLFDMALIYCIIYLGFAKALRLDYFTRYGDFSYGFYIYAWPIQQMFFHRLLADSFTHYLCATFVVTSVCAVASWYLIEKPALALKKRGSS